MKTEQVLETYDSRYAAEYDDTFLLDGWTRESVAFQLRLLEQHLGGARNWLDVACGTGFVLSQFPHANRAGLDLSPAMLEAARRKNPTAKFYQRNFREPFPEWNDRWDLVTCMWWAYCLAESVSEVREGIARLSEWTSPEGKVFVPLCNPQKFDRHNIRIPYIDPRIPGRCMITGITWTWIQENGKRHDEVVSPQVDHVVAMFRQYFEEVDVIEGPLDSIGEGWRVQDVLVAKKKRAVPLGNDLFPPANGERPGVHEWLFSTAPECLACLSYPTRDRRRVRVSIDRLPPEGAWTIRAEKTGYSLQAGRRYRLSFQARAEAPRSLWAGVSMGQPPWGTLGLYQQAAVGAGVVHLRDGFHQHGIHRSGAYPHRPG